MPPPAIQFNHIPPPPLTPQWISGAGDPRNAIHIVLAVTDPSNPSPHKRHSLVLVPPSAPGVKIVRPMTVFGYDDAPEGHCEVVYDNVTLRAEDAVVGGTKGLGQGFAIIQARLGPGRLHHCMRSIGVAERALEMLLLRVTDPVRRTFGKALSEHGELWIVTLRERKTPEDSVLTPRHRPRRYRPLPRRDRPVPPARPRRRAAGGQARRQGGAARDWRVQGGS
jgi:hypothetical protein